MHNLKIFENGFFWNFKNMNTNIMFFFFFEDLKRFFKRCIKNILRIFLYKSIKNEGLKEWMWFIIVWFDSWMLHNSCLRLYRL
jgi:hypothetical protein